MITDEKLIELQTNGLMVMPDVNPTEPPEGCPEWYKAQVVPRDTYVSGADVLTDTQQTIQEVCREIMELLIDKNRKYGDSVCNPKRIFSTASAEELINVRIDDKINRLIQGHTDDTEDTELDLIGYLILKRVLRRRMEKGV